MGWAQRTGTQKTTANGVLNPPCVWGVVDAALPDTQASHRCRYYERRSLNTVVASDLMRLTPQSRACFILYVDFKPFRITHGCHSG